MAIRVYESNRYDKAMTYSFDIFDTCLVRKCGEAKNVFDLLAEQAFVKPVSSEFKRAFVAARIEAEANSWSEKQKLSDIYDAFHFEHVDLFPKNKLLEIEQTIEREVLCPIQGMANFIDTLRKAGNKILFISDMYLDASFLLPILKKAGLWKEGDGLYVSCDAGATKASGKLFEYIRQTEDVSYRNWHHYGDNVHSDVQVPKKLGIHAHLVSHQYTPYQLSMRKQPSVYYQWGGMLAGISRSIALQSERNAHKDFVLDIIAPLFVSFVYRVMANAKQQGIQNLYFCARDAYPLYRIACKMQSLFPNIEVSYLYISRTSLYEGENTTKIGYFQQIGLASNIGKNAIVDVRSSGKTLQVLNELLISNGFSPVYGYFFELCPKSSEQLYGLNYYAELDDLYIQNISIALRKLPSNWYMYELYFPLNTQKRTIGYEYEGKEYKPILDKEDKKEYRLANLQECVEWRNWALDKYTEDFVQLGLCKQADDTFKMYALPQLAEFFLYPDKHYLDALREFYGLHPERGYIPYVDNSLLRLPMNVLKHKTMWKRGTLFCSLPIWLSNWLYRNK